MPWDSPAGSSSRWKERGGFASALFKTLIGSVGPDALKTPARRAEYSLTGSGPYPIHAELTPTRLLTLTLLALTLTAQTAAQAAPRHYVFFNLDRHRIREPWFADTPTFEGAQLKYTWRQLEPAEGVYQLQPILDDLAFLRSQGKRLFIQLQDVSFDTNIVNVPDYLRQNPAYNGGVNLQYAISGDDESKATPEGWVARRWDPAVRARFHALLAALGRALDGHIEGINLPETSVGFGDSGKLHPPGFTPAAYRDAILSNIDAARAAFPRSVVIQYANFMPGEWLPWSDRGYLKSIYAHAARTGAGVGGPDLLPFRKAQQNHSLALLRAHAARTPAGVAIQHGNYDAIDPATKRRVTISTLLRIATADLRATYLYWSIQEPYFTRDLIPALQRQPRLQ